MNRGDVMKTEQLKELNHTVTKMEIRVKKFDETVRETRTQKNRKRRKQNHEEKSQVELVKF